MNLRAVGRLLGIVLLLMAGFLLVPVLVAIIAGEERAGWAFFMSSVVSALTGFGMAWMNKGSAYSKEGRPDYFRREGLAVVGLAWLIGSVAGALPYLFGGTFDSFVDAFFESASGLSTTGSTVMSPEGIDGMPKAIAFWRSFTHWLGGFGIVMVFVVLFPTGGRSLFRSEIPGISREAGHQRVRDSAIALMRIYVGISALEFVLLWVAGMTPFDSLLHTFGTIATGGFSNHSSSVAYFSSVPIEMIITFFMFMCGFNFAIYDTLLRVGLRPAWRSFIGSTEAKAYLGITVGATLLIAVVLWFWGGDNGLSVEPLPERFGQAVVTELPLEYRELVQDELPPMYATTVVAELPAEYRRLLGFDPLPDYRQFLQALRDSVFQVVCMSTSTGYGTADFDRWPQVCRVLLMLLAVTGACAGSTGGGIKVVRMLIVAKAALNGVRRFVRPRAIHSVRMDGQMLDEGIVASVTGYFALWTFVFMGGTLFLSAYKIDPVSAATGVLATLNNIGPGLHMFGPAMNYAELPDPCKLLLSLFMILGRLEFYAVVALFVPSFWRR